MTELAAVAAEVAFPAGQSGFAGRRGHGRLDELRRWLAEMQDAPVPQPPERVRMVVFTGRNGIAEAGVSVQTDADVEALAGRLAADATGLAEQVGASTAVHRLDPAAARIDRRDALAPADVQALVDLGVGCADAEIDAGAGLLLPVGLGAAGTTAAATVISALTGLEPARAVGRGAAIEPIDDQTWMRKAAAVRDARRRVMPVRHDPQALLSAGGSPELAALSGFLVRAAARRTPVLLDGSVVCAAALAVHALQPRAARWWLAAHVTSEPAHQAALDRLALDPLLDLGLRLEDGTGPLLAVALLTAAARLP